MGLFGDSEVFWEIWRMNGIDDAIYIGGLRVDFEDVQVSLLRSQDHILILDKVFEVKALIFLFYL